MWSASERPEMFLLTGVFCVRLLKQWGHGEHHLTSMKKKLNAASSLTGRRLTINESLAALELKTNPESLMWSELNIPLVTRASVFFPLEMRLNHEGTTSASRHPNCNFLTPRCERRRTFAYQHSAVDTEQDLQLEFRFALWHSVNSNC